MKKSPFIRVIRFRTAKVVAPSSIPIFMIQRERVARFH